MSTVVFSDTNARSFTSLSSSVRRVTSGIASPNLSGVKLVCECARAAPSRRMVRMFFSIGFFSLVHMVHSTGAYVKWGLRLIFAPARGGVCKRNFDQREQRKKPSGPTHHRFTFLLRDSRQSKLEPL